MKSLGKMELKEMVNSASNNIIDVRESYEFNYQHTEGTSNIPLSEIVDRVEEFKQMTGVILLCCVSGNRSGNAEQYLKSQGIENVVNVGSWMDIRYLKENAA